MAAEHDAVRAHLDGCPACAHEDAADAALSQVLERRLPQHPAPIALKRRLAGQWATLAPAPPRRCRWVAAGLAATAAALVTLFATAPLLDWPDRAPAPRRRSPAKR